MKAILMYHSIDDTGSPISISRDAFARHVRWLASGRVRVTSVEALLRLPDSDDAVAITFDDGFRNFGEIAAPLLSEHALPSTLFVVSHHVGGTNAWGRAPDPGIPILPLLDWGELGRLAGEGVSIGGHTKTHRRLEQVRRAELEDEIGGGCEDIRQRLGVRPTSFAYPYGSVSEGAATVVAAAQLVGCTTELRVLHDDDERALLPRLDMYYFRGAGRLERWGTTRFDYYLKLRSGARRLRQSLTAPGGVA